MRLLYTLRTIVLTVVVAVVVTGLVGYLVLMVTGRGTATMGGDKSMEPTISANALLVTTNVPGESVQIGQVVHTERMDAPGKTTRRVTAVTPLSNGGAELVLKADSSTENDPLPYTVGSVDKVDVMIPFLGSVVDWVTQNLIIAGVILVALLLLFFVRRPASLIEADRQRRARKSRIKAGLPPEAEPVPVGAETPGLAASEPANLGPAGSAAPAPVLAGLTPPPTAAPAASSSQPAAPPADATLSKRDAKKLAKSAQQAANAQRAADAQQAADAQRAAEVQQVTALQRPPATPTDGGAGDDGAALTPVGGIPSDPIRPAEVPATALPQWMKTPWRRPEEPAGEAPAEPVDRTPPRGVPSVAAEPGLQSAQAAPMPMSSASGAQASPADPHAAPSPVPPIAHAQPPVQGASQPMPIAHRDEEPPAPATPLPSPAAPLPHIAAGQPAAPTPLPPQPAGPVAASHSPAAWPTLPSSWSSPAGTAAPQGAQPAPSSPSAAPAQQDSAAGAAEDTDDEEWPPRFTQRTQPPASN